MSDNSSPSSSRASTPVILTAAANTSNFDTATPTPDPNSSRYRFAWDPERRGPESVSGTTAYGQDYFAAAPTGLGFHFGGEWSSSRHGFHAISTVLNNPHKRQAPPKAHSSLPSVMPAELPRVRRKDFDSYVQAITPEWEKLEKHPSPNVPSQFELQQAAAPSSPDFGPSNRRGSLGSLASFSSLEPLNTARLQALNRTQPPNMPPLDTVPPVFFESDFDFGNPRTFALVTEQDESGDEDPVALAHSLPLLEKFSHYADTIEMHLSTEIAARAPSFFAALTNLHTLQSESTATLSQISRLRAMLEQVDENVAKKGMEVVALEKRVRDIHEIERSVKGVKDVVKFTGEAREKVGQGLWGDSLVILGVLDEMWGVVLPPELSIPAPQKPNGRLSPLPPTPEGGEEEDEHPPPAYSASPVSTSPSSMMPLRLLPSLGIPLSQLNAFSALPGHLRNLTLEIASSLSDELVSILRDDLQRRLSTKVSAKGSVSEEVKDKLTVVIEGLIQTKGVKEATLSWREVVLDEVRQLTKKHFTEFDSGSPNLTPTGPTSDYTERPQFAAQLRSLPHSEFMFIMRAVYRDMLSTVEGLQMQTALLGELTEAIEADARAVKAVRQRKNSRPPPTPLSFPSSGSSALSSNGVSVASSLLAELTDTLSSATELGHTQAAQLLSHRSEIHSGLSLPEFIELFNETWEFVVRCEVVCRRMIVGLRGAIVSQAKVFLQTFHQSRLTQSAKLVEDEQWSPQDVTLEIQTTANMIIDAAMKDPAELVLRPEALEESRTPTSPTPRSSLLSPFKGLLRSPTSVTTFCYVLHFEIPSRGTATNSKNSKHLYVESSSFFTVPATSSVLSLLTDYLAVIINLGILTTDTMSRIIEFLKAFNSRTCQVVLGAGAMRSAGLKNITAKHLALASQSLSIMIALVPYIRETFRRHLSSKQAVMLIEFDKLKRDYQEHQHEIHAKLIAIMGDRLTAHIKSLQAVNWNVPKSGGGINEYMEVLVKETVTLHKVLSRYLSPAIVEDVMSQVFAAINHRLSEEYGKIELPNADAKLRLLEDARFLHQKLSALKTVGKPSMMLETVVQEKPIPRLPGAPPTPTRNGSTMSPPNSAASNTSTNQRLKSLLSGRSTSYDRTLPSLPGATENGQQPLASNSPPTSSTAAARPPSRSNTTTPIPENEAASRTMNASTDANYFRSLSPNPSLRLDRPRTPPPPVLPIDVEAEVDSPPPEGSSTFGFREFEPPPDLERPISPGIRDPSHPASNPQRPSEDSNASSSVLFDATASEAISQNPEPESSPNPLNGSSGSTTVQDSTAPGTENEDDQHRS
ncbi:Vps54-like protein-domain-containing protein [Rhodocollybia butyracea]|uniref:Vps54-like protein-domain-containing protein n=1 Tax=Rhodocollybia butyracea TaxID=206335 RepID=A0A9P5PAE0_9AGAR|nr:Vps54-like protein-domain-containing protein [Rhodocollybia butyracea]